MDARARSARRWLSIDAAYCAAAGLVTIVLAEPLFRTPAELVAGLGVATLVWASLLAVNTGTSDVKLYSLYSPPEHPAETVHRTKAESEAAEHSS